MSYLLDTNVLSELRKGGKCDEKVRGWAVSATGERHWVSVLCLGEIRKGIELLRRKSPEQCPAFERWLVKVQNDYAQDILPVTETIVDRWGRLMAIQPMPVIDGLLAATALVHDLTMVTRNVADFPENVRVLNPWDH